MAATPKTRRSAAKSGSGASLPPSFPGLVEIVATDLFNLDFVYQAGDPDLSAETSEYRTNCKIKSYSFKNADERDFFMVDFKFNRTPTKHGGEDISAAYICIFDRKFRFEDEASVPDYYRSIVALSVFPKFRDLVGTLMVQGNLSVEKPSLSRAEISWVQMGPDTHQE